MKFIFYNTKTGIVGELPEIITLESGLTRTDPSSYTDEELQEWGYVQIENQPQCQVDEYIMFNRETLSWDILKKPFGPQWDEVKKERNKRLEETDWYVIRFIERAIPIPDEVTTYRKALRDITTQENPFFIEWPSVGVEVTSVSQ